MNNINYKIALLFLIMFSNVALAKTPVLKTGSGVFTVEVKTYDELTATLEEIRQANHIPAMAVAVISSGEVSYIKGFGYINENKAKPTTQNTSFRIASISKLFTAQAIMQLVEANKLKLSDNVSQYLPTFDGTSMTIKQLLTHSSGLSDSVRPVTADVNRSQESYLKLVRATAVNQVANQQFEYSDTGFNILGRVISAITGVGYEQYISENILLPAGMEKSKYVTGANRHVCEAPPTKNGKLITQNKQRPYDLSFNPSEGLVTTVHDLSLWLKRTLNNDNTILKEQTYKSMLKPQIKTTWGEIYMGLGWQVYKSEGVNVARHPGGIRGYKSLVITYPGSKDAIILLTNSSNTPRWEIAKSMTKILKNNGHWSPIHK